MGKIINVLLVVLFVILGFLAYQVYMDLPLDPTDLSVVFKQELPQAYNTSSELVQFAPNMRFATSEISYYFQPECGPERISSTREAFKILS